LIIFIHLGEFEQIFFIGCIFKIVVKILVKRLKKILEGLLIKDNALSWKKKTYALIANEMVEDGERRNVVSYLRKIIKNYMIQ